MRSPALAIGWEIWARSRAGILAIATVLAAGTILTSWLHRTGRWVGLADAVAYTLTVVALLLTAGCFHFTEGSKKGGFGSFPIRLFHLPMNTRALVGWPMIYGAAAVVIVYLLSVHLFFPPTGKRLPILWPCLYLVFSLTQFQMIIWSLPESRYLKLLGLSIAASVVTFGWMFFVPNIIAGALNEWGYTGDPDDFLRHLLVVLALTGPAAFVVSLHRIRKQRLGKTRRSGGLLDLWERCVGPLLHRREPFCSADHALLCQEWRRSGFILPIGVCFLLTMTCLPAGLSGSLSGRTTLGVLTWIALAPFFLATIIGCGFSKPDFWSTNLKLAPFQAIRPVSTGQWVTVKLKVALGSAALTWFLTVYLAFIWTALAGEPSGIKEWIDRIQFFYSPAERWMLLILAAPVAVMVTWRFLVTGLAAGLSGRKPWYYGFNLSVGAGLAALFVLTLWQGDREDALLRLYRLWPAISWLPAILSLAAVLKVSVAAQAWNHALSHGLIRPRSCLLYWGLWLLAAGILASFFFILCRNTLWLRHLLMLVALLAFPLAGPAWAMRSLATNRCLP